MGGDVPWCCCEAGSVVLGVFSSFSCSVSACSAADSLLLMWRVYNLSIVLRVRSGARERVRAVDRRAAKARREAAGWGAARSQAGHETVPRKAPAALCEGEKGGARAAPPTPRVATRAQKARFCRGHEATLTDNRCCSAGRTARTRGGRPRRSACRSPAH